jgi:SAM-dependent methyltransferase
MTEAASFDAIWEEKYASGHQQRYPWDCVVSFVFRNAPKNSARSETTILEVGCGTGGNLWFAAREGFRVIGVDGSASAIAAAKKRFADEGLAGDLRVADFVTLPFDDASADLAIDRGALTCCGTIALKSAIAEVHRVLRPGGRFLFNPYADSHSSARSGMPGPDGLTVNISAGTLTGVGHIRFASRTDLSELLAVGWKILSLDRIERCDMLRPEGTIHAEWLVVAEKV